MASPTRLEMAFMEAINETAKATPLKPERHFVRIAPEHDRIMTSEFSLVAAPGPRWYAKTRLTEIAAAKSLESLATIKLREVLDQIATEGEQ